MTGGIQVGDRYLAKKSDPNASKHITNLLKLDTEKSLATVCLVKDEMISLHIDHVPRFYSVQLVMPLGEFSSSFRKATGNNLANSHKISRHFPKKFPEYFIKILS